jgi:hypothetical protein
LPVKPTFGVTVARTDKPNSVALGAPTRWTATSVIFALASSIGVGTGSDRSATSELDNVACAACAPAGAADAKRASVANNPRLAIELNIAQP